MRARVCAVALACAIAGCAGGAPAVEWDLIDDADGLEVNFVAFHGNSLTRGVGPNSDQIPFEVPLRTTLGPTWTVFNLGFPGITTAQLGGVNVPVNVLAGWGYGDLVSQMHNPARTRNVLVMWEITNSICGHGDDALTTEVYLRQYAAKAHAQPWSAVFFVTAIPRACNANLIAQMGLANAWLRSSANQAQYAFRLIDPASDSYFDLNDSNVYLPDKTHLTSAANARLASTFAAALRGLP